MKSTPSNPQSAIRDPQSPQKPSALLRAGASRAFAGLRRLFVAAAGAPRSESPTGGRLQTILLPHARTRWMLPAASGMTPAAVESILKEALTGRSPRREQELYSLMESTWPRLLKNRMEVVDSVLGLDWNLMEPPAGEGLPGAKELIERTKNGMKGDPAGDGQGWRATLASLLDAWFRGISIAEIEWEYRSGGSRHPAAWLPRLTRDVPPWHFGWRTGPQGSSAGGPADNDGRLVLYPDANATTAIDFPPNKFLLAIRKAGKGHPSGTALLRCLAWWWCAANFSQEWLLNFAQIFGQPFRWATYDASQEGVRDDLAEMMEQMASASWGVGPEGSKVEFHESAKNGADNPQAHLLTLADTACDLLLLGQTLTGSVGKDGGSRALGEVHQNVRGDIIDSAALWLAEVLNEQLIPAVVTLNLGPQGEDSELPWFQPTRKSKRDTKVIAETFEIVLRSGIPLLKEEVYDQLDLSQPREGDQVFSGNPQSAIPNPQSSAALPPEMRRVLAKLPLDAREYVLARLDS